MLDPTLQEAAAELALALRQAPAIVAYRAADDALAADATAQEILAAVREQQQALGRLQAAGLSPTQAQLDVLRGHQQALRECATLLAYLRATNKARRFLPQVAARITAELGVDFAKMAASGTC